MWAVCGVGKQSSALSTGMVFEKTAHNDNQHIVHVPESVSRRLLSRAVCPQATPVVNLDRAATE